MTFLYPLAFALGVATLLAMARRRTALLYPEHAHTGVLAQLPRSMRQRLRAPVLSALTVGSVAALTVAAARPQLVRTVPEPTEAHNVILTLDISRSMLTADFTRGLRRVSRLEGVKEVVSQFLADRPAERIGLVVFGAAAYLQAPLTMDHDLLRKLVESLKAGVAGDGTAIGEGLGLSVKRVHELPGKSKAIVLLTDGVNNAGNVNPMKAARVAKDLGIKVHTIGIGSTATARQSPLGGIFGTVTNPAAEFDEKLLHEIAALTGGVYFNADSVARLKEIYDEIDALETSRRDEPDRTAAEELFTWFAIAGVVLYLAAVLLARGTFLKIP